jgi:hypothetical protein
MGGNMFEPWFIELIQFLSTIAVGSSAVVVAIVAIIGLAQWKKELTGKAKFEVAKNLAQNGYQYVDQIMYVRNPVIFAQESIGREREEDESLSVSTFLDERYARLKRLEDVHKTLIALNTLGWEAEILFNKNMTQFIAPFGKEYRELNAAIKYYFNAQIERAKAEGHIPDLDVLSKRDYDIIYGGNEAFSISVDNALEKLLTELRQYIN